MTAAKKKNKGGRPRMAAPPALIVAEILKRISDGCMIKEAVEAAGISHATFYTWKKSFPGFSEALKKAYAAARAAIVANIAAAGRDPKHWTAGAWILERRHPNAYGKRLDVTSKGEKMAAPFTIIRIPDKSGTGKVQDPKK